MGTDSLDAPRDVETHERETAWFADLESGTGEAADLEPSVRKALAVVTAPVAHEAAVRERVRQEDARIEAERARLAAKEALRVPLPMGTRVWLAIDAAVAIATLILHGRTLTFPVDAGMPFADFLESALAWPHPAVQPWVAGAGLAALVFMTFETAGFSKVNRGEGALIVTSVVLATAGSLGMVMVGAVFVGLIVVGIVVAGLIIAAAFALLTSS